jgi:hypothetical protein
MQRVRIGLTGLAFVFLLVLLAAIVSSPTNEAPITANSIEHGLENAAAPDNGAEPREPLAELGVAPRNPDANAATAQVPTPAAPVR